MPTPQHAFHARQKGHCAECNYGWQAFHLAARHVVATKRSPMGRQQHAFLAVLVCCCPRQHKHAYVAANCALQPLSLQTLMT